MIVVDECFTYLGYFLLNNKKKKSKRTESVISLFYSRFSNDFPTPILIGKLAGKSKMDFQVNRFSPKYLIGSRLVHAQYDGYVFSVLIKIAIDWFILKLLLILK